MGLVIDHTVLVQVLAKIVLRLPQVSVALIATARHIKRLQNRHRESIDPLLVGGLYGESGGTTS